MATLDALSRIMGGTAGAAVSAVAGIKSATVAPATFTTGTTVTYKSGYSAANPGSVNSSPLAGITWASVTSGMGNTEIVNPFNPYANLAPTTLGQLPSAVSAMPGVVTPEMKSSTSADINTVNPSIYDKQRQEVMIVGTEEEQAKMDALRRRMAAQGLDNSGINLQQQRLLSNEVSKEEAGKTGAIDLQQLQAQEDINTQLRSAQTQRELATLQNQFNVGNINLQHSLQQADTLAKTKADSWYNKGVAGETVSDADLAALQQSDPLSYASYMDGKAGKTKADHDSSVSDFQSKRSALIAALDYKTDSNFVANLSTIYNMKPGDTIVTDAAGIMHIQSASPAGGTAPTTQPQNNTYTINPAIASQPTVMANKTFDPTTGLLTQNGPPRYDALASHIERILPTGEHIPSATPTTSQEVVDASGVSYTKYITSTGTTYYLKNSEITSAAGQKTPKYYQPSTTSNGVVFVPWTSSVPTTVAMPLGQHWNYVG
jgi:hypothetical protein